MDGAERERREEMERGQKGGRGDAKDLQGEEKKKKIQEKIRKGFGCMQETSCWRNEVSVRVLVPIGKKSTAATTNGLH